MARMALSRAITLAATVGLTTLIAACGGAKPAPIAVAPPPPPVPVAPPRMPSPPSNAVSAMAIPMLRADGLRDTPMRDIDDNEKLWYFRAAFNVAALNCQNPQHYRIADDYNQFLKTHKRELDRVNKVVEEKYRKRYGTGYARIRDTENTQVYNFFAFPPVKGDFCDAALVLGQEAVALPSKDLVTFSVRALPTLEGVFDRFYASYESYQSDLQKWIALYGSPEMRAAQAAQAGTSPTVQPALGTAPGNAAPTSNNPPVLPTVLPSSGD
ncbi:hypothetical protein C7451_111103 [Blastomonas natatoria]|uniref:Lipoprotein n=1 Tax=Blastomonas natatoria TaxID=34015 RepID=A0A2V3UVR9_9SPHN|nr:hypothetical protein [Blastomonas natatoria]PXW72981.1 hypothetical protein C7451_111103 [Blastomonas natatoria]